MSGTRLQDSLQMPSGCKIGWGEAPGLAWVGWLVQAEMGLDRPETGCWQGFLSGMDAI
jgi:hypothetical protein